MADELDHWEQDDDAGDATTEIQTDDSDKESQMEPKSREVILDINKITSDLRKKTAMLEPLSDKCRIYKVPVHLYNLNMEAYTPKLVSIGPFHHGNKQFRAMEAHKLRFFNAFLDRINTTMEDFIEGVKKLEINLRESYTDMEGHDREKFIKIMAVDGAFLMQYLLMRYNKEFKRNDRVFGRQQLCMGVRPDLLLLENQLPFFYLDYLFSLYKKSNDIDEGITLMKVTEAFLTGVTQWDFHPPDDYVIKDEQVCHLLHLLTLCLRQSHRKQKKISTSLPTPTISELHRAGVKFKPSSTNCISFADGLLEIPILRLIDQTEQYFRNMQAFEQCHRSPNHVGDYLSIMGRLIKNEEDVQVIVKNGIVQNWLEDNRAAATVFNNLGHGNVIYSSFFSYNQLIEDLSAYYKKRRHKWKTTLKQNYFKNPWTIISVVAASILLLLTVTQTVFSILQGV